VGIDPDETALAGAAHRVADRTNVTLVRGDVMTADLQEAGFDLVAAVASIHHLPLEPALGRLATLVRPGGSLAIVGPAQRIPKEQPALDAGTGQHRAGRGADLAEGTGVRLGRQPAVQGARERTQDQAGQDPEGHPAAVGTRAAREAVGPADGVVGVLGGLPRRHRPPAQAAAAVAHDEESSKRRHVSPPLRGRRDAVCALGATPSAAMIGDAGIR